MVKRKDLVAAKKRGMVSRVEVDSVRPEVHRRYCPMDGETFLPPGPGHKGFCCSCCAFYWGRLLDARELDRRIGRGMSVVVLDSGERATVLKILSTELAKIVTDEGEEREVSPAEIEKIQYTEVKHFSSCGRKIKYVTIPTEALVGTEEAQAET